MFRFAGSDKVTLLVPLDLFGFRARVQCRGRVHHRRQYSESSVAVSTFGAPRDHRLPFPWPENFYFQNSKQHYYNIVSLSYVHPSVSCVCVCNCAFMYRSQSSFTIAVNEDAAVSCNSTRQLARLEKRISNFPWRALLVRRHLPKKNGERDVTQT
jgi:hypothetical protein